MPDLDVKAEKARVEAELQELDAQLKDIEAKRQGIINEMVRRQGVLTFLERLNGSSPPA
ncbi:MAG: hypothetical protein AAB303_04120 [Chloroflexota bacterium]